MDDLLGLKLQPHELGYGQIILRALIVFIGSLIIVRLGAKRFLGRKTIFDFILAFILGSMLSRAINGSSPFFSNTRCGIGGGAISPAAGVAEFPVPCDWTIGQRQR